MAIPNFLSGWVKDPSRVQASIAARQALGQLVMGSAYCRDNAPSLRGTWQRRVAEGVHGIFLRDSEWKLLNRPRRPYLQRFGTCVSRGMARGVQTSLDFAIVSTVSLSQPVEISFAPIYSMARHEIGRDRCGGGDGAILADAARAVHELGVATTELFQGMTEDAVERLAVQRAAPGVGTPDNWLAAARGHTCATFWPETLELIFDCIAAGYAVPYAHSYVTGRPNAEGISDLGTLGPHCRCFTGVFLDQHGQTQLVSSESWGRFPAGDPQNDDQTMPTDQIPCVLLRYAGGVKKLAPGDVGIIATRWWNEIEDGGEAWGVSAPRFNADSLGDATRPAVAA
jgi:hypothetical protein